MKLLSSLLLVFLCSVVSKGNTIQEECKDSFSRCKAEMLGGKCESRKYWMEDYCKRTCGFCGCFDVRTYCPKYKSACVPGEKYHMAIKHYCRETCKICVNGKWGGWEPWSQCSVTCGGTGKKTRKRLCNNPSPTDDGTYCQVAGENRRAYEEKVTETCNDGPCSADGNWGEWVSWSSCSATCGDGHQTRTRQCNNPSPFNGGEMCQVTNESRRDSFESETKPCNAGVCPVNGNWGKWGPWSKCSATCGGGHMSRGRQCDNPSPSNGGSLCEIKEKGIRDSSQVETKACGTQVCPSAECDDKSSKCKTWKEKNLCERAKVKATCKKSCGVCVAECNDKSDKCKMWKEKDLCSRGKVKETCKKSCGICGVAECNDKSDKCKIWKEKDLCSRGKVKETCKKSCGICDNTSPTTTPVTYPPITQGICGNDTIRKKHGFDAIVKKIVGGEESAKHTWIWQGIIQYRGKFHCGGTLITSSLFLTAAHCVHNLDKDDMDIRMGYHNRIGETTTGQVRTIKNFTVSEDYFDATANQNMIFNDIALIKVNKPFDLNKVVGIACLPNQGDPVPENATCYITGWGKTRPGGIFNAKQLQEAQMFVKPYDQCENYQSLTERQFCGGGDDGIVSACSGDSGGPLVCKSQSTWVIQGVISFGNNECRATEGLTVFSRVSMYIKWLNKVAASMA